MIYHEYEFLICSYLVCVGSVRYTLLTSLSFHARPGRVKFHGGMSIDYFSICFTIFQRWMNCLWLFMLIRICLCIYMYIDVLLLLSLLLLLSSLLLSLLLVSLLLYACYRLYSLWLLWLIYNRFYSCTVPGSFDLDWRPEILPGWLLLRTARFPRIRGWSQGGDSMATAIKYDQSPKYHKFDKFTNHKIMKEVEHDVCTGSPYWL